jgi:hypothetical protein
VQAVHWTSGVTTIRHQAYGFACCLRRYYFNQWMRQRIHLTLLELHLAAVMPSGNPFTQRLTSSSSSNGAETSISSARGQLLLSMFAEGGHKAPAVSAAAAAAGFQAPLLTGPALALPAADASKPWGAAAAAGTTAAAAVDAGILNTQDARSDADTSSEVKEATKRSTVLNSAYTSANASAALTNSSGSSSGRVLQLPEPVVSKLLALDAGDLDLMVQHPVALQGQVYELLDVLQVRLPLKCAPPTSVASSGFAVAFVWSPYGGARY